MKTERDDEETLQDELVEAVYKQSLHPGAIYQMLATLREKMTCDDDHAWGYQIRMVNEPEYCGKFLVLENKKSGSFHYHKLKKETFIVLTGKVMIGYKLPSDEYEPEDDPHSYPLTSEYGTGSLITFVPRQAHGMWARETPCIILEVSTHDDDSDTYRIGGE